MQKTDVAAYIWPAYTGDEPRARMFWPEGIGEWQTVKSSAPKANGYHWDRKPLLGYQNEADPLVMEQQIELATQYGVSVFIYDWYWYDNRPFLENCLNDGFLKASNCEKMQFYVMWANHDANYTWDKRNAGKVNETIWQGAVDRKQFEIIGRRWIDQYFCRSNYYRIDQKPVVSIYDLNNFVSGLGGVAETKAAIEWLQTEAQRSGLPGVHFQFVRWNGKRENISGVDGKVMETTPALIRELGFESLTHYQFVHFTDVIRNYEDILPDVKTEWELIRAAYDIPYFPHISLGWDNNPRFLDYKHRIMKNNTPEQIKKGLEMAKAFAEESGVSLITLNSWNEWTETSYLLPDNLNGYGYLEAVQQVFKGEEA